MTIIEKIAASIHEALDTRNKCGEVVDVFPFYYDTPETINLRLDHATFPCAMMHVVESGIAVSDNGVLRERLTIKVVFANMTTLDFDGLENERIIEPLKRAAFCWLQVLRRSSELRLGADVETMRYYATNDAIVTGFEVTLRVEEIDGISICDLPYKAEDDGEC